ncbi:hypothetical protein [Prochlorococcus sp. MIT 1300]|uniref:hypothetical protein n=1 Tax=Prochlorococcus sp. MIT 1300 TaxID=3096218 RepID=UPI002A758DF6|nr:hypothetical protein [Prochlorococcus sp. MIT 1300]
MNFRNEGLTVGELTMAVATLIIVGLIWTTFNNQSNSSKESTLPLQNISTHLYT